MENEMKNLVKIIKGNFEGWYGQVLKKSTNGEKVKIQIEGLGNNPIMILWRDITDVEYEFEGVDIKELI